MLDRDQQLIEAASDYLEQFEREGVVSVTDYVAQKVAQNAIDPELREELTSYLELVMAVGEIPVPAILSAEEQALAEQAATRMRERWRQRVASAAPQSLTQLRGAAKLALAAVARRIDLPVDLLARIERGSVDPATIPDRLVTRLADVFGRAASDIRASLSAPRLAPSAVRLSAEQGTVVRPEGVVSFAEALAESTATESQRQEWN